MKEKINPVGLKGKEINERMKQLMGIAPINEEIKTSVVELTKKGPDGKVYAIVRENHEYYIKTTTKQENLVVEDFQYIGGLQNKKQEAYPSYAKAIKHLNLKFHSLNEAYGKSGQINVFLNDKLLKEDYAAFESMGSGFKSEGNMDGHMRSKCCGAQTMEGMCMECGGSAYGMEEEMGMMAEKKYSDAASEFISKEISHLMKDKGYTQDRAVAAALSVAREKGYKVPEKSDEGMQYEMERNDGSYVDRPVPESEELAPEMEAVDAMMEDDTMNEGILLTLGGLALGAGIIKKAYDYITNQQLKSRMQETGEVKKGSNGVAMKEYSDSKTGETFWGIDVTDKTRDQGFQDRKILLFKNEPERIDRILSSEIVHGMSDEDRMSDDFEKKFGQFKADKMIKMGMSEDDEMTDKEKKFAALAPPHDKITYADKIAGATKGKNEGKLSIERAMEMMDEMIDELHESRSKKKI